MLTTGEIFPTSRLSTEEVQGTEMDGVEHLGQYVFEMTQAKVGLLKTERSTVRPLETVATYNEDKEIDSDVSEDKVKQKADESEMDNIT